MSVVTEINIFLSAHTRDAMNSITNELATMVPVITVLWARPTFRKCISNIVGECSPPAVSKLRTDTVDAKTTSAKNEAILKILTKKGTVTFHGKAVSPLPRHCPYELVR